MSETSSNPVLSDALAAVRRIALPTVLLLAAAAAVGYARLWRGLAPTPAAETPRASLAFAAPAAPTVYAWSTVRATSAPRARAGSSVIGRFRLAGTFVVLDAGGDGDLRKAIVDDLEQGGQLLVGEGERIGRVLVARVWADRIVLNADGEIIELRLSYLNGATAATAGAGDADGDPEAGRTEPPLEVTRYGERIAEGRWRLSKAALNEYYQEMLDNPERIGKLFETFEPVYAEGRRIEGYRLAIKGEEEFLRAAGLKEGDIVRSVNSLQMSSQSRAEFFIREFVQNRLETVVIDVEREGRAEKFIYFMQ